MVREKPADRTGVIAASIDVQTVSGVQRMGTSDFLIGSIAGQIPAEFEVETLKAQAVMARSCLYKQAGDRYYISASDTGDDLVQ